MPFFPSENYHTRTNAGIVTHLSLSYNGATTRIGRPGGSVPFWYIMSPYPGEILEREVLLYAV